MYDVNMNHRLSVLLLRCVDDPVASGSGVLWYLSRVRHTNSLQSGYDKLASVHSYCIEIGLVLLADTAGSGLLIKAC